MTIRQFSKRTLVVVNILAVLFFLLGGIIPYTKMSSWPWMGFFSLAFPYLLIFLIVSVCFWVIVKPRFAILSFISILLCFKQIGVLFSVGNKAFDFRKSKTALRVMTWNVKIFEGGPLGRKQDVSKDIIDVVVSADPDLVCLQEFSQYDSVKSEKNHIRGFEAAGYKYHIFSADYERQSVKYRSGCIIFSKTPFLQTGKIPFANNTESILYGDFVREQDTVRIFTTHLQSFKFNKDDYQNLNDIKTLEDFDAGASRNLISKMKASFGLRASQAKQIAPLLFNSPYPEILCGDLNDVPTSYVYWQLRGKRKDAFLEKGKGLGQTFFSIAPTLRIDHIFCNPKLEVDQFVIMDKKLSDHLPLLADFRVTKNP